MFLLIVSFIAGVLTVLAPCILPLLPVIIGGSVSDGQTGVFNKKKAFTIIISLGVSVILFTLLLKASTLFVDIPEYVWKWISGGIVLLLGLVTFFPQILESQFFANLNAKSNILMGKGFQKKSFWGDVLIGASLGPVFSTCSPTYFIVLATVLPVSPIKGIVYLLSYVVGLGLTLLLVSVVGQKILNTLGVAADPRSPFKKILGILFIVVGIAIIFGLDKQLQTYLVNNGLFDITKVEQKLLESNNTNENLSPEKIETSSEYLTLEQKNKRYKKVVELSTIDGYINTGGEKITLESLKGKVVLLDIWTYSCINCQRTLPYINSWYSKYKENGLEVVGLHTPEFAFEKVQENVENAVKKFNIKYPVVMDNDYSTWNALGNQYWPRKYLVDIDGYIIYDHIGEGGYEETEAAIQYALNERAHRLGLGQEVSKDMTTPTNAINVEQVKVKSPEVYFGSARNEYLSNGRIGFNGVQNLNIPDKINLNSLYLGGNWIITNEYAENISVGTIVFKYNSKNVYMAGGSKNGVEVEIYKDDKFLKKINIKEETLYTIIQGEDYGEHTLRIVIPKAGLKAFTFTFG